MLQQPFNALFCDRFHCPIASYEERAFTQCLYWHARLLAAGFRKVKPDFFAEDLKFIRNLGAATGLREAGAEAQDFHQANRARPNFFRTGFGIRVSERKATRLAEALFSEARRNGFDMQ